MDSFHNKYVDVNTKKANQIAIAKHKEQRNKRHISRNIQRTNFEQSK